MAGRSRFPGKGYADYKKRALSPLFIQVLYPLNTLVQTHCDCAQDDDGGDYHVELEHLRPIDNQIPQPPSCRQEFSDNDAYQSQADIDLHIAEHGGNGGGKHDLMESVKAVPAKGIDELELFGIHLFKAGVKADHRTENCHGNTGNDDRIHSRTKPDNEKRCKGGFGQAV